MFNIPRSNLRDFGDWISLHPNMTHLHSTLPKLGLTENQAKVYTTALELGEASITDIARKAGLKRPTVYLLIEELELMGIISSVLKGKRLIYTAQHPNRLLEIARSREKQIEEIMPELLALHNSSKEKPKIQVFEGVRGLALVYDEMYDALNNKAEMLFFADTKMLQENFPYALTEYKKRIQQIKNPRIRELNFGDAAGKEFSKGMAKLMKHNPNYAVRTLPPDYPIGTTDNLIFGSKLVIFSHKQDLFVIVIDSVEVAKTYRVLFEWAWKNGRPA